MHTFCVGMFASVNPSPVAHHKQLAVVCRATQTRILCMLQAVPKPTMQRCHLKGKATAVAVCKLSYVNHSVVLPAFFVAPSTAASLKQHSLAKIQRCQQQGNTNHQGTYSPPHMVLPLPCSWRVSYIQAASRTRASGTCNPGNPSTSSGYYLQAVSDFASIILAVEPTLHHVQHA